MAWTWLAEAQVHGAHQGGHMFATLGTFSPGKLGLVYIQFRRLNVGCCPGCPCSFSPRRQLSFRSSSRPSALNVRPSSHPCQAASSDLINQVSGLPFWLTGRDTAAGVPGPWPKPLRRHHPRPWPLHQHRPRAAGDRPPCPRRPPQTSRLSRPAHCARPPPEASSRARFHQVSGATSSISRKSAKLGARIWLLPVWQSAQPTRSGSSAAVWAKAAPAVCTTQWRQLQPSCVPFLGQQSLEDNAPTPRRCSSQVSD